MSAPARPPSGESPRPTAAPSFGAPTRGGGGESREQTRRTGALDAAADQVAGCGASQLPTAHGPVHRAVWERTPPVELFASRETAPTDAAARAMEASLAVVRRHRDGGSLHDADGRIAPAVLAELGAAGYWGLLVESAYGGTGSCFAAFAPWLSRMAAIDPTVAGLASVHGCIGAVHPLQAFGTPAQKERLLPDLASGARLGAFALTEPGAGTDLTALRTRARRDGDRFLVTGEKLFITNALPGRTIALVCLVDERPAALIVELPEQEDAHFQLRRYELWALKHTVNHGLVFRDFPVPVDNLLTPPAGDGLTIAYHGLNRGRVALCANAAGSLRIMLASLLPWAGYRVTYGQPLARRELVRRRLAELAGLIVGCDALAAWCSGLIDAGHRGEMECVVAKIFASEAQKHAAVELLLKTHGGRSFLRGHLAGDHLHDYLAPCIYEGEGEMLSLGFFKALVKDHGKQYFEPLGRAAAAAGIGRPNLLRPGHAWALRSAALPYVRWRVARRLAPVAAARLPAMPAELRPHAALACEELPRLALEISKTMSKFQLALADRQGRMAELSSRCQSLIVLLVVSLYGARQTDPVLQQAAAALCRKLARVYRGDRPSDADFRRDNDLGAAIAAGGMPGVGDLPVGPILMPYAPAEP
jgi:alkylation response protein AidB-like acyl-CoA dehydrogenase